MGILNNDFEVLFFVFPLNLFHPTALRTAKTQWSFGRSESNRVETVLIWDFGVFVHEPHCCRV